MASVVGAWVSAHKSLIATATSGTVIAALIATVAIVSNGYTAQKLDLGDSSVWVANDSQQYVGRANTQVLELNTVVANDGNDLDLVQDGATVLVVDTADARLDIVDPAVSAIDESVPLPPETPSVYVAGDNAVIVSRGTGELWIVPLAELAGFDAAQQASLTLGAGTVVSVDDAGSLVAYSPEASRVYRVDAAGSGAVESTTTSSLAPADTDTVSVTSVGSHWAVLDAATGRVEIDGRVSDLAPALAGGEDPVLQAASPSGDAVLVSTTAGLVSVPVGGGEPTTLVSSRSGTTAAPVVRDGCVFAAWSDGGAWRHCATDGEDGILLQLSGMTRAARLVFQGNEDALVLNDVTSGASWAVQESGELIDNWDDLIDDERVEQEVEENDPDSETEVEKDQQPPVAADDEFGARPGRTSLLPVLLNDYDPNGDVIVIDSVEGIDEDEGSADIIGDGQRLQLTLADEASGELRFDYSISDGRGGSASASVVVTVRDDDENSPPEQRRSTSSTVVAGGTVSVEVLSDWVDPDGDPFYLTAAAASGQDSAAFTPAGTVMFTAGAQSSGESTVALTASDGDAEGSGSLEVTVGSAGDVPIVAESFVVRAYAGQEITIAPLDHVHGGSATIRLNAVPPKSGVTITPTFEAGTFRFVSDQVRTHYLEYVVTDDDQTATGVVRVDVTTRPDVNEAPITVPKTVFVYTLSSETVNVAATDIDPAGGVLLVTGVTGLPSDSGVQAEVLDQESVRVSLVAPLDGPVTFGYRVTNGLADAPGTITVIEIPLPDREQPPIARDDTATARVGDAITIDVLANDEQPDGRAISLVPELVEGLTGASGLLFVSGNVLRYLAPDAPGNFTAIYEVASEGGQTAQAEVRIQVREPNVETNNAPVPETVTARVIAGERVRVDIPLTGIDPDGDSVQFLGQETNPEKGAVTAVGSDYLEYEAGEYSAGTDEFTYAVVDSLGSRATGTVRVGITARLPGARNPVAVEDEVTARPGTTVSVQVLANDYDPDGSPLTVTSVEPAGESTTAIIEDESVVTITPPSTPGTYGVVYVIENEFGGSSSNFVTVEVREDAPLSYPIASDTVLTLTDILDRETIDVDVLRSVFFADGSSRDLGLTVLGGYGATAEVTSTKRIRVTIQDEGQIIPFAVSHPADPSVRGYAFIWVPGFNDALPQLNTEAPPLSVLSGDELRFDINDYVVAVAGRTVRLTDSSTVRATHSDGSSLVVDSDTLRFISADNYSGPASISFEVTDETDAAGGAGGTATLVLPISVTPRENQPPVFTGAVLDFEPDEQRVIDLARLTSYPHPDDLDQLVYSTLTPLPTGFSFSIDGRTLTLRADADAPLGTSTALNIGVRDTLSQGQQGVIRLSVVPSTRPLARPITDAALTKRGETTVVDVLDNDEATNPFPGQPLTVTDIRGTDGASLPAGVSVAVSEDRSRLTVTVSADAEPVDSNFQYQVADATGAVDRRVWGRVRISVQDVPDQPDAPVRQADEFVNGELKLRITPTQSNNAEITGYRIESSSHGDYAQDCGTTLICSLTGLEVGEKYRFRVVAVNAIGSSEASDASAPYSADYRPEAPSTVTAVPSPESEAPRGASITVTWPDVPNPSPGSPVVDYTVGITGPDVDYSTVATSPFVTPSNIGLSNDVTYTVTVYARNSAQVVSASEWRRTETTVRTIGPPTAPRTPRATINSDNTNGEIRVTWGSSDANGAGSVRYSIGRVTGTADAPACVTGGSKPNALPGASDVSSGWVDTATTDGESYTYFVYADNGLFCTSAATSRLESKKPPGKASGTVAAQYREGGRFDVRVGSLDASGIASRFEYRIGGSGSWRAVSPGSWITSAGDASVYGNQQSVTFRACRDSSQDYCGAESDAVTATPVQTRASPGTCVTGELPTATAPANAGSPTVTYAFSYLQPLLLIDTWSDFAYSETDPVPSDARAIRVRATVTIGGETFTDPGYGDQSANVECTTP